MVREADKWRGVSMVTAGSAFCTDGDLVAPNSAGGLLKWMSVPFLGKKHGTCARDCCAGDGRERPATAFCPGNFCVAAILGLIQFWEVGLGEGKSNLNNPPSKFGAQLPGHPQSWGSPHAQETLQECPSFPHLLLTLCR